MHKLDFHDLTRTISLLCLIGIQLVLRWNGPFFGVAEIATKSLGITNLAVVCACLWAYAKYGKERGKLVYSGGLAVIAAATAFAVASVFICGSPVVSG